MRSPPTGWALPFPCSPILIIFLRGGDYPHVSKSVQAFQGNDSNYNIIKDGHLITTNTIIDEMASKLVQMVERMAQRAQLREERPSQRQLRTPSEGEYDGASGGP